MVNNLPESVSLSGDSVDGSVSSVAAEDEVYLAPSGGVAPSATASAAAGGVDPPAGDTLQGVVARLQDELARERAHNERVDFNLCRVVSAFKRRLRRLGRRHRRLVRAIQDGTYPFLDLDDLPHGSISSIHSEEEGEENVQQEEEDDEEEEEEERDDFSDDDG